MSEEERKSKDIFRTVNGINGININKVLEFVTGEKAIKYSWDDEQKEFVYKVKQEFASDEPIKITKKELLERFADYFQVKVKLVDF